MKVSLEALPKLAKDVAKENKQYFARLKKRTPKDLDYTMNTIHDEVFEKTDCLKCANCCKTTSPIFTEKDITRISKHFKMKERAFIEQYLDRDDDDFFVLKSAPCTFLGHDDECMIYDVRPKACSEYPHTNRKKFIQLTDLTIQNTSVCPAAYEIVEKLKQVIPLGIKQR